MFEMYSIIFISIQFLYAISAPIYSNYEQYVQFEIVKTTSTILYNTTTPPSNTTTSVVAKAEMISNKIDEYIKSIKILVPSFIAIVITIYTLIHYAIKLYKNNCVFKRSWLIKSPKEYQRRRQHLHERQIAMDEFLSRIQETSQTIYSIT